MTPKPRIFIASASKQDKIVQKLVIELAREFDVTPWYNAFPAGELTMQALVKFRDTYDAALCVFGKDDQLIRDGAAVSDSPAPISRDNVVLEFGLFLGAFGPRRVLVIAERGVKIPTDLSALTVLYFDGDSEQVRDAQLSQHSEAIKGLWAPLPLLEPPAPRPPDDHRLGFRDTLLEIETRLSEVRKALHHAGPDRKAVTSEPVKFDLTDECISTYAEALNRSESRFWVTTYWKSGFWTNPDANVLKANAQLSARLAGREGTMRRLFLLKNPLEQELERMRDDRAFLRRAKRFSELERLNDDLQSQRSSIERQQAGGFEVRVAHETEAIANLVPQSVGFKRLDTEVAIFDDFRADFYNGVKNGRIQSVHCYTPMVNNFEAYLSAAQDYFNEMWKGATPVNEVLERIERAVRAVERQVDYEPYWLSAFELGLTGDDEFLKTAELARIMEITRKLRGDGVSSLLDIGTCTARYPIALVESVKPNGAVLGIDIDQDCVRFADSLVRKQEQAGTIKRGRVEIRRMDFLEANLAPQKFGLITCTLGTLSHFGFRRNKEFRDALQDALCGMRGLLEDDGLLIISNWSETVIEDPSRLLSIYLPRDRQQLAQDTARQQELENRLASAGLRVVERADPDIRLDVYVCQINDHVNA